MASLSSSQACVALRPGLPCSPAGPASPSLAWPGLPALNPRLPALLLRLPGEGVERPLGPPAGCSGGHVSSVCCISSMHGVAARTHAMLKKVVVVPLDLCGHTSRPHVQGVHKVLALKTGWRFSHCYPGMYSQAVQTTEHPDLGQERSFSAARLSYPTASPWVGAARSWNASLCVISVRSKIWAPFLVRSL